MKNQDKTKDELLIELLELQQKDNILKSSTHKELLQVTTFESNTRSFEGPGLGLSIAKAYVEMLGGHIGVESNQGKGSTFHFTIPYLKK